MKDSYVCENTKTQLDLSKGPYFVADHYKKFRCNGWGTFARLSADQVQGTYKAKKPNADSFQLVSNFGYRTKAFKPNKRFACHGRTWGKDVAPNYRKQCFCEARPRKAPIVCAKEGQMCRNCNGVVFYGIRMLNGRVSSLDDMLKKNYRWKETTSKKNLKCTNKIFGGDPNRGRQKQCYCDDVKYIDIAKIKADEAFNRGKEAIRREKKRLRSLAQQRKRRLRAEAQRKLRLAREKAEKEKE